MKHQCSEYYLIKGLSCRSRRCTNNAKVKRNGKWYCGIHDPEKVRERREKNEKKKMETLKRKNKLYLSYLKAKNGKTI